MGLFSYIQWNIKWIQYKKTFAPLTPAPFDQMFHWRMRLHNSGIFISNTIITWTPISSRLPRFMYWVVLAHLQRLLMAGSKANLRIHFLHFGLCSKSNCSYPWPDWRLRIISSNGKCLRLQSRFKPAVYPFPKQTPYTRPYPALWD